MKFNIVQFLNSRGIPYITTGPNVKRGNINVHCPMCGGADPSMHLGIALDTMLWGCWRNPTHRGGSLRFLLKLLARLSEAELDALVGSAGAELTPMTDVKSRLKALGAAPVSAKKTAELEELKFLPGIRGFDDSPQAQRCLEYLQGRGLDPGEVQVAIDLYGLKVGAFGAFSYRVIFPFVVNHKLVGWTGRAIVDAEIKYVSHPASEIVKQIVFNHDSALRGGRTLFVVEGPWDTVRTDLYAQRFDSAAVGILGTSVTEVQVALLLRLAQRFEKIHLLLDADAHLTTMRLKGLLSTYQCSATYLREFKDPGEMPRNDLFQLVQV